MTKRERGVCGEYIKQNLGLYEKYYVERTDGSSRHGGKHERCDYFVLDLTHDRYALSALRAYAEACEAEYPRLAADLRQVRRVREGGAKGRRRR